MRVAADTFLKLTSQLFQPGAYPPIDYNPTERRLFIQGTPHALTLLLAYICKGQCRNSHHFTNY